MGWVGVWEVVCGGRVGGVAFTWNKERKLLMSDITMSTSRPAKVLSQSRRLPRKMTELEG